jgi:Gpi18-like mannosyltransferase
MQGRNRLHISYTSVVGLSKTPLFIIGFFTAVDVLIINVFWRDVNADLVDSFIPWYQFLFEHGRFSALAVGFYDYTPPYLYLLTIGTLAHGVLDPATVIRAISVSFNAVAAVLVYLLAVATGWSRPKAIQIAFIFFILPEMVVNSLVWGQCDIIYTLFLLAFIYFLLKERGWWATTMLGIAFAFKLQTVFIGPFVLYLLLVRLLLWRQLVMLPLMYLLFMVPAALTGRSWDELLTIYVRGASFNRLLSLAAPNPYFVLQSIFPNSYELGLYIGLVIAVIVSLILVTLFVRRGGGRSPHCLLLMATLTLTIIPYVLPKMHERYFFPASAMAFLLAVVSPSTWPIVVLIQTANLCSYTLFLLGHSHLWLRGSAIFMTCALGLLIWLFFQKGALSLIRRWFLSNSVSI